MAANDKVTYVLIRLDEKVEPEEAMREMVERVKGAIIASTSEITVEAEEYGGAPVIYYP